MISMAGSKCSDSTASGQSLPLVPDAALILGALFPTGSDGYRGRSWEPDAVLSLAWQLFGPVSLGTNFGAGSIMDEEGRYLQFRGSVTVGVEITDRLGWYGEYFVNSPEYRDGGASHAADSGLTFLVTALLQIDLRFGRQFTGEEKGVFAGVGFVARADLL